MKGLQRIGVRFLLGCIALNIGAAYAGFNKGLLNSCESCHNESLVNQVDIYPILHGQKQGYLEAQLKAFRDGTRENALMADIVKGLSDKDITQLATHYSNQTFFKAPKQAADRRGADVRARCVSCHGLSGKTINTEWPNLLGQNSGYLLNQLNNFASGERKSVIMQQIANELTPEQRQQVALYYDQQGRAQ
ncbi:c-type cytochrome [Vibrio galatheae]|uniref:c-type cytochrome n=1 Tax=Vibrio galatheae TaxID=579748 RepID=UPI00069762B3|nr:c-type cytochrome [Vibrio galatheae]